MKEGRREIVVEEMRAAVPDRLEVKIGGERTCWLTKEEARELAKLLIAMSKE